MNFRNFKTISPISGSMSTSLNKYIEDVKNGTNKVLVKSIRKANKAKDLNQMKMEMDKLPLFGKNYDLMSTRFYFNWRSEHIIQIEILDIECGSYTSMQMDRHTMIQHRNVLDNGYILWFYYTGPKNTYIAHNEAIDTLVQYIEDETEIKIDSEKYKDSEYLFEIGYDPNIYTNIHAEAFNFKYWKKKYESRKQKVA